MFREMRRSKQLLPEADAIQLLQAATSGVLALSGDNGYPYAVPLSFVYDDGRLYFHSAVAGHKIDALQNSDKASFCVIDTDEVLPEEYTTRYRSVIAFGRVRILENDDKKRRAMILLGEKYNPGEGHMPMHDAAIENAWDRFVALEMAIEHISGKVGKAF